MAKELENTASVLDISLRRATFALALAMMFATAFLAAPAANAQTYTVLHSFTGGGDGGLPGTNLVMDRAGNLYGTTFVVGSDSFGGVFKLVHGRTGWVLYPLYSFSGTDGSSPRGLIMGPDGSLYGTNSGGGGGGSCGGGGCGTVFRLAPPATVCKSVDCPWTATILHHFTGQADGGDPLGALVYQDGNLYGTTRFGGSAGNGVVYELSPSSGGWTETVLYTFNGGVNDGANPYGGVIFDSAGNLYGTTSGGEHLGTGSVFELSPSGSGWAETALSTFGPYGGSQPYSPLAGLIRDSAGNLYGTTNQGGSSRLGTVFSVSPSNGGWVMTSLYSFNADYGDERPEFASLFMDAAGSLYGTTPGDEGASPSNPYGNVFQMTPSEGGWSYDNLYSFTGGSDGGYPFSTVIMDGSGNLYGTTNGGGIENPQACNGGCGVVWEITP
jgi:uncharacterized repeat protein (TIGR03803 family)